MPIHLEEEEEEEYNTSMNDNFDYSNTNRRPVNTYFSSISSSSPSVPQTLQGRVKKIYFDIQKGTQLLASKGWDFYYNLSIIKRILLLLVGTTFLVAGILFIIFHEKVFELLVAFAESWKELKGGPYIMFLLITIISFPPLIGYSTLGSLCGMMYGFPGGWPLLTAGTLFGSTLSFLVFRYFFSDFATKLAQSNRKFAALTKTMEQDNFTLLWMIRLCPLPYSLSNGALASIPSVSATGFFLATLVTSPKLFIHVFIGDRIARLGTEKDTATKIVDVFSILLAVIFAAATAYTIYIRTIERAEHLDSIDYDNLEMGADEMDDEDDDLIDDDLLRDQDDFDANFDNEHAAAPRRHV